MSLFSSNDEHFCTPFVLHNQTNTRRGLIEHSRLEPENEYGNVEYKLRLTDPSPERIERLVTQLKWRIREGNGEAILFLGVKDDGQFVGLTQDELKRSIQTLERMSSKIGAKMTVVKERIVEPEASGSIGLDNLVNVRNNSSRVRLPYERTCKENLTKQETSSELNNDSRPKSRKLNSSVKNQLKTHVRKVIQVLVKRRAHDISEELRVAVLGPTESGKSSLLGVLSHGENDNGRGSARLNLFRHRHEIRSGHTSSISQEIFGFTSNGQPLTYGSCLTTEEIIESSSRIVTLIDLAGHQRYLNTTLFGLGSHSPDLLLIVLSATSTITSVATDFISLALGIEKPLAIVINKTDLASQEDQENCYDGIVAALQLTHPDVVPFKAATLNDAIVAGTKLGNSQVVPIFFSSCVTGYGLNSLYAFFNQISPKLDLGDLTYAISQPSELQVDETFVVPGIGTVVSGLMVSGIIREGDDMLIGPDDQGNFSSVSILSLQRHKIPCNFARAGQKCTMAIAVNSIKLRKGMVMKGFDPGWRQSFSICLQFTAKIKFINDARYNLTRGSQVSVYVGNVRQTSTVESIESTANNAMKVNLRLTKRPEYIRDGSRIIIRHALTKGVGTIICVKQLFHDD